MRFGNKMIRPALTAILAAGLFGAGIATLAMPAAAQEAQSAGDRKLKSKVSPVYPELAKRSNISGVVKVEVMIAANGSVKATKPVGGHPLLIGAAEDAVRKWRYEPAAGDSTAIVEFHFNPGM